MNRYAWVGVIQASLAVFALSIAAPVLAAEAPKSEPQAQNKNQELGEVLVEGSREKELPQLPGFKYYEQSFEWLARMVGRFVVDGQVDLQGEGGSEDLRKVSGRAECVGFGSAPGVQCEWKIRWPDSTGADGKAIPAGVSNLNPATVLFGLELVRSGISWILVDSQGVAETTVGEMITADTMRSRTKCGAIAGNCTRLTRITAWPDRETVEVEMDFETDQKKLASFRFVMHRVPGAPSLVYGRKQEKEKKK